MKMFTDCSGECCICACGDACLTGHGDDFRLASKDQLIKRLDNDYYSSHKETMLNTLKYVYDYKYQDKNEEKKYTLSVELSTKEQIDSDTLWEVIKDAFLSYTKQTRHEVAVFNAFVEEVK